MELSIFVEYSDVVTLYSHELWGRIFILWDTTMNLISVITIVHDKERTITSLYCWSK